jgi:hypothetical protein
MTQHNGYIKQRAAPERDETREADSTEYMLTCESSHAVTTVFESARDGWGGEGVHACWSSIKYEQSGPASHVW